MKTEALQLAARTPSALREEVIDVVTQAAHSNGRCPDVITLVVPWPEAGTLSRPIRRAALEALNATGLPQWARVQQARLLVRAQRGTADARIELQWLV